MAENATTQPATHYEIRSEAHGPHWVAWAATPDGKPLKSVLLVARTQPEAEERARTWLERQTTGG